MFSNNYLIYGGLALAALWFFAPDLFDRLLESALQRRLKNKKTSLVGELAQSVKPVEPHEALLARLEALEAKGGSEPSKN